MKILIFGAGKMGTSILKAFHSFEKRKEFIIEIVEPNKKRKETLKKKFNSYNFLSKVPKEWKGDILLFAIKPQDFKIVAKSIRTNLINFKLVVSIMAGIEISTIKKLLKRKTKVIRAMPNLPVSEKAGVICLFSNDKLSASNKTSRIIKIFKSMGKVYWLKKEKEMNIVTAISGSGPAYFFLFILSIINAAKKNGFRKKLLSELVYQTANGALVMVRENSNLEKLIKGVCSKGGTTEAALNILINEKNNLPNLLTKAISEARKRSEEISVHYND